MNTAFFNQLATEFQTHLTEESNDRIIFSAPFGTGKSTFLRHFFQNETQKQIFGTEPYNVFHLYPVNYSVGTNEDIFKYIKYDIFLELIRQKIEFQTQDFDHLSQLANFGQQNFDRLAKLILLHGPNVGGEGIIQFDQKQLASLLSVLNEVRKKLKENLSEKNYLDEGGLIHEYLLSQETSNGNLFEFDIYSQLITKILKRIAETQPEKKKNILIIDDLDRIDPEHIFRLFNVFAAHLDHNRNSNKFGFDQVIFVCDIKNIKQIFSHKYGTNVDFDGYIDKFYSKKVYDFINYSALAETLTNLLISTTSHPTKSILGNRDIRFLTDLLTPFIEYDIINFRNILKADAIIVTQDRELSYKHLYFREASRFYELEFVQIGLLLVRLFGSYDSLLAKVDAIKSIYEKNHDQLILPSDTIVSYCQTYLLPITSYRQHLFQTNKTFDYLLPEGRRIQMTFKGHHRNYEVTSLNQPIPTSTSFFFHELKKAVEILRENSIL